MTQGRAGQAIWCLGMYASASTWAFNVVRQVIEAGGREKFRAVFVSGQENAVEWDGPGSATVVKSHEIGSEARVVEVARRASKLLITVRDPRDAVVSLMQAHAFDFARALPLVAQSAALCASFAKDRRAKLLRYETGFFDRPATVVEIAAHLGYRLGETAALAIHDSLKRSAVEAYIGGMPQMPGVLRDRVSGDLLDPRTQWHSHHAGRNGAIGKWREVLTPGQSDEIMSRTGVFFELP